jgi:hypothetical protein
MRITGTKTIPQYIRQKTEVAQRYGKPVRPLTTEDFEIVPEHDEEQVIEVRCDICGSASSYFKSGGSYNSLIEIFCERALKGEDYNDCTKEFLGHSPYEVCESCMRVTIAPYLMSLCRPYASIAPEEQSAVMPAQSVPAYTNNSTQTPLIGAEEELPTQLPPLSDEEPF